MRLLLHSFIAGLTVGVAACSSSPGSPGGGNDGSPLADGAGPGTAVARIIRGDPNATMWFNFAIEGHGLAGDEGRLVTARIGVPERPPERLGSGQVRIQDGAFRIEFPQGCEFSLYKPKFLFIDVDADGVCTPGVDRVYSDSRALEGDLTITLSDSVPKPPVDLQMLLSSTDAAASSCPVLNEPWPES
jgi:hypothetical protein